LEDTYEDKKAEVYLVQGEAFFQEGKYAGTIEQLSACLKCRISEEAGWIECTAYNLLGDLFLFSGYEAAAMENYLNAKQKAKERQLYRQEIYAEIKIGLMYNDMGGQEEALRHFDCAIENARQTLENADYELLLAAYIQKAYLCCKMGEFASAKSIFTTIDSVRNIHPSGGLPVKYKLLKAQIARESGDMDKLTDCIQELLHIAMEEKFSMEYCRFYLDVCVFLLECGRKNEMKQLLEALEPIFTEMEFISVGRRFLKIRLSYDKRFSSKKTYQETCIRYMAQSDSYRGRLQEFRRKNIQSLDELQQIRRERDEYREKSRRDLSTGLLNKAAIEEEIRCYMDNRSTKAMDAFVILDIDNFKNVNDVYGHLIGDSVILKLSRIMKETYRKNALLGRFGGDEFVIFIQNIKNVESMEQKLEKFKEKFHRERFGESGDLCCSISVGVSYNREVSTSYEALFECADEALYKAKEYGKDRIAFYEIKEGLLKYL